MLKRSKKNFLDLRGFICPDSIMMLRKNIRLFNPGDRILILSDDISFSKDLQFFCNFMGHKLISKIDFSTHCQFFLKVGKPIVQ